MSVEIKGGKGPATVKMKVDGCGFGHLSIGGHDLEAYSRNVVIKTQPNELTSVNVEVLAVDGIDVELPAYVTVIFQVIEPGIVQAEKSDGGKTQRVTFKRDGTSQEWQRGYEAGYKVRADSEDRDQR